MVIKATAISHGKAMDLYMTNKVIDGNAVAHEVSKHGLYSELGEDIVEEMELYFQNHTRLKNPFLRIEICPSKEESREMTQEQWKTLCEKVIERLKLDGHQYHAVMHEGGNGGGNVPHLHVLANRIPMEGGPAYSDWQIRERCKHVADELSHTFFQSRQTASEIGQAYRDSIVKNMEECMKEMPSWDTDDFIRKCQEYDVYITPATYRNGIVAGYHVRLGQHGRKYKLSSFGEKFRIPRLEQTYADIRASRSFVRKILGSGSKSTTNVTGETPDSIKEVRARIWAAMRCMPAWDLEAFMDACRCHGVQVSSFIPRNGENAGKVCLRFCQNGSKESFPFWRINKELAPDTIRAKFGKEKAKACYNRLKRNYPHGKRVRNTRKDRPEDLDFKVEFGRKWIAWKDSDFSVPEQQGTDWKMYLQQTAEAYETFAGIEPTDEVIARKCRITSEQYCELQAQKEQVLDAIMICRKEKLEAQILFAELQNAGTYGAVNIVSCALMHPERLHSALMHLMMEMGVKLTFLAIRTILREACDYISQSSDRAVNGKPYAPGLAFESERELVDTFFAKTGINLTDEEQVALCHNRSIKINGDVYRCIRAYGEYSFEKIPSGVSSSSTIKTNIREKEHER